MLSDERFIEDWQGDGVSCREIRSHRAPARHRGALVSVLALSAVAAGFIAVHPVHDVSAVVQYRNVAYGPVEASRSEAPQRASRATRRGTSQAQPDADKLWIPRTWMEPIADACWNSRTISTIDFVTKPGESVRSVGSGMVVRISGLSVTVDHSDGSSTTYGQLVRVRAEIGEQVEAGDRIGISGKMARLTVSSSVDPLLWLTYRGIDIAGCATVE